MANGHGGYRKPENPAAVSGPGALSKRTDGGAGQPVSRMTGLGYGENKAYMEQQTGAPMADTTDGGAGPAMGGPPVMPVIPLNAPTDFKNEPITAGAPFGPGAGPALQQANKLTDTLKALLGNDISGAIEEMYLFAESQGL